MHNARLRARNISFQQENWKAYKKRRAQFLSWCEGLFGARGMVDVEMNEDEVNSQESNKSIDNLLTS